MTLWKAYHLACNLDDALHTLATAPGLARLVAGGTDLLLDLQQGRCPPVHTLVDITRIPELNRLEIQGERLFIGAAVPLGRLIASPLVQKLAPALWQACGLVGGPQVRNTATLGGNVAHALPAGDGSIALLALAAKAQVASTQGKRLVRLEDLFQGPGRSALDARHEILTGFYLPPNQPGDNSAFRRIMRPQGVALPILNMAIWLHERDGLIHALRIAIGPAGKIPHRALAAEAVLTGQTPDPDAIGQASGALLETTVFRSSPHRASAAYRRHLTAILLKETLYAAWEGAINGIHA